MVVEVEVDAVESSLAGGASGCEEGPELLSGSKGGSGMGVTEVHFEKEQKSRLFGV